MSTSPSPPALPSALPLSGRPPDDPAKVRELAHEFESMLLLQMLRQMRQSMLPDDEEEQQGLGLGGDTMTDTIDQELARQLSLAGGIGIADVIIDALNARNGVQGAGTPSTASGTAASPTSVATAPTEHRAAKGAALSDPAPTAGRRSVVPTPVGAAHVSEIGPSAAAGPTPAAPAAMPAEPAVPLPLASKLTSHFGWRADPLNGRTRFHAGVDVRAAYGCEVPVVASGRVVSAGEHGGYGLEVVVEHASGLQTRYAHLSASLVRAGDEVTAGQPVGRVGSSGRSTGPHLHFEVVQDGRRVDPELAAHRFAALGQFKNPGVGADSPNGGEPPLATEE